MEQQFYDLVDDLNRQLRGPEVLLADFSGEESDFVRFNRCLVRQAGAVQQRRLSLELIDGRRHLVGHCTLAGAAPIDRTRAGDLLLRLRQSLPSVPEDPYLLYNPSPQSTRQVRAGGGVDAGRMTDAILDAGQELDLVGILAGGAIHAGFANSLGQRNWFSTQSFHLDWCFYHAADKAIKSSYAGFAWDQEAFGRKMQEARAQLELLVRPARSIPPGRYRVYLAPAALDEVMNTLSWGGFGVKAQRTKTTSLLRMVEGGQTLSPAVTIRENTAEGLAPNFYSGGFLRPAQVTLIDRGRLGAALVSPRSAREYGLEPNGSETPQSLDLSGGQLPSAEILARLDCGLYISRLWYLNYSDRAACRMTGMTRFATFWVEDGQIVAPVNVMRFDETIYRILGENLVDLTVERELLPSESTYGGRSTNSSRLPGALVADFAMTL